MNVHLLWGCFIDKVVQKWVRFALLLRQPAYRNNWSIHHSRKWFLQFNKGKNECSYRPTPEGRKIKYKREKDNVWGGERWVQRLELNMLSSRKKANSMRDMKDVCLIWPFPLFSPLADLISYHLPGALLPLPFLKHAVLAPASTLHLLFCQPGKRFP